MDILDVRDVVGSVLCHDLTQIIPGVCKDARFRKGHIIQETDIPVLLSMGKEHLYVWEKCEGMLHEDEAAQRLCALCETASMTRGDCKEGKLELFAACDGLFKVDRARLHAVNAIGEMMIASRHGNTVVQAGDKLLGTRVIPLVIAEEKLQQAEQTAGQTPLCDLLPLQKKRTAIITTGNEVASGRITDQFGPVLRQKLAAFDAPCLGQTIVPDDAAQTAAAIHHWLAQGAELILCTGGMSVDPDDKTPLAIRDSGAQIISYGAPVLPGAMLLLAYAPNGTPIVGLPGCVMYAKRTIFDLILPRLLANDPISAQELAALGEGGLCLNCTTCTYPNCGFGKGW